MNKKRAAPSGADAEIGKNLWGTSPRFRIYFLIFFNLILFSNTLFNRFTYDDILYIAGNPHVQNPGNVFELFRHTYPPHKPELSLYRPLVELTYLLDWSRGLKPSEFADLNFNDRVETPFFHLTNIAFHIAAALTILFLVRALLKNEAIAFVTALLFSAHPTHVETVTSIVGRAESMSAFFFLLSLYLFIREKEKERLIAPLLLLSYLMFFFALLSKESAITLPPVIFITAWFVGIRRAQKGGGVAETSGENPKGGEPRGKKGAALNVWKSAFIQTAPYLGVFLFYLIIRLRVVGVLGVTSSGWYFRHETTMERLSAMSVGFLAYLRLLIFPVFMSVDYNFPLRIAGPFWAEQPKGFMDFWAIAGLFVIVILHLFLIREARKKSPYAYAVVFFLITMFPFSNILPFGDFIAERFLYLPSFGYCLFAGILFAKSMKSSKSRKMAIIILATLLTFYSMRTFLRNRDWRSGIHLWKAEFRQNPRNPVLYSALGSEYMAERRERLIQGNAYRKKGDFKKAAHHLELARDYEKKALEYLETGIRRNPKDIMGHYNYGMLSVDMLEPDLARAEKILLRGAAGASDNPKHLHVYYYYIGMINLKRDPPDLERALKFLKKSYRLDKSSDDALTLMSGVLGKMGKNDEALEVIRKVLSRNPGNMDAVRIIKIIRFEDQNKK